ncbi:TIGR04104 family putative zinc finger protein [Peribacillus loiseleuriae]|uniref:Cxxc_20_cxxc protein n=1 Tax=Peribacillus loiseleuriae TaxID=1679170 RepID=A0A0K9GTT3_9BACI|nr:hypothetical protein AC625_11205 [Peribacillus loiseleuriae]
MQKCENCNSPFSWSKIFKSFWWTYKPIECDNCGTKHKITIFGRFTFVAMSILPIWIFPFFLSPFDNIFGMPDIGVLIGLIGFLFTPYVVQYEEVL